MIEHHLSINESQGSIPGFLLTTQNRVYLGSQFSTFQSMTVCPCCFGVRDLVALGSLTPVSNSWSNNPTYLTARKQKKERRVQYPTVPSKKPLIIWRPPMPLPLQHHPSRPAWGPLTLDLKENSKDSSSHMYWDGNFQGKIDRTGILLLDPGFIPILESPFYRTMRVVVVDKNHNSHLKEYKIYFILEPNMCEHDHTLPRTWSGLGRWL